MCVNRLRYAIVVVLAGLGLFGFFRLNLLSDTWPVVLTGEIAPGTSNGRFTALGQAAVNSSGDIVFHANLDIGGVQSAGIFKVSGGVLSPVALEGESLADSPGQFLGRLSGDPQINNSGDVVFIANFAVGVSTPQGLFLYSGGTLRKLLDTLTAAPGGQGQTFGSFRNPHINDTGDIAFAADLSTGPSPAIYRMSQGAAQRVVNVTNSSVPFSLNNRGDISFITPQNGVSIFSNGSIQAAVIAGQAVPNTNMAVYTQGPLSMNDDGDVAFVNYSPTGSGRGGNLPAPNGIVRTRAGVLEKVAKGGDPVPGIPGATLDSSEYVSPEINMSSVLFTSRTFLNGSAVGLIIRHQDGQFNVVAREDQVVPVLSRTLNFIGDPNFDTRQGPLTTFVANLGPMVGIFAATVPQFTLLFPQIADGADAGGGWRTAVILANRSTTPASATLSFYDDNGAPMNVGSGGQQQSQYSVLVPALGVSQFQTDGVSALKTGWAMVQTDQSLSGIALFGFSDRAGSVVDEVGADATVPLRSFSVFVQSGLATSTGIALINPNTSRADLTLILKDSNSNEVARSSISVPSMGHLAKYASEIFTGIQVTDFQGKMEVISTQPLAAITLRQRGQIFTSLPVIP